jgi:hypothetical protein
MSAELIEKIEVFQSKAVDFHEGESSEDSGEFIEGEIDVSLIPPELLKERLINYMLDYMLYADKNFINNINIVNVFKRYLNVYYPELSYNTIKLKRLFDYIDMARGYNTPDFAYAIEI